MARGFQKVTIIGNVGQDPEVRETASGTVVANLSVAVSQTYKGEETTTWFRVAAFGPLAEVIEQHVRSGEAIFIEGEISTSEYVDREGIERRGWEVRAREMRLLGGKPPGDRERPRRGRDDAREPRGGRRAPRGEDSSSTSRRRRPEPPEPAGEPDYDDIPF